MTTNSQVICLIESGRWYLLDPGSQQEIKLLKMLERTEKGLKEDGRTSKDRIRALSETISSNKRVTYGWPLTAEELEAYETGF